MDGPAASIPGRVACEYEIARGGHGTIRSASLDPGATVRDLVRVAGLAPEGVAALVRGRPVALSTPIEPGEHVVLVPTFSGG